MDVGIKHHFLSYIRFTSSPAQDSTSLTKSAQHLSMASYQSVSHLQNISHDPHNSSARQTLFSFYQRGMKFRKVLCLMSHNYKTIGPQCNSDLLAPNLKLFPADSPQDNYEPPTRLGTNRVTIPTYVFVVFKKKTWAPGWLSQLGVGLRLGL